MTINPSTILIFSDMSRILSLGIDKLVNKIPKFSTHSRFSEEKLQSITVDLLNTFNIVIAETRNYGNSGLEPEIMEKFYIIWKFDFFHFIILARNVKEHMVITVRMEKSAGSLAMCHSTGGAGRLKQYTSGATFAASNCNQRRRRRKKYIYSSEQTHFSPFHEENSTWWELHVLMYLHLRHLSSHVLLSEENQESLIEVNLHKQVWKISNKIALAETNTNAWFDFVNFVTWFEIFTNCVLTGKACSQFPVRTRPWYDKNWVDATKKSCKVSSKWEDGIETMVCT